MGFFFIFKSFAIYAASHHATDKYQKREATERAALLAMVLRRWKAQPERISSAHSKCGAH